MQCHYSKSSQQTLSQKNIQKPANTSTSSKMEPETYQFADMNKAFGSLHNSLFSSKEDTPIQFAGPYKKLMPRHNVNDPVKYTLNGKDFTTYTYHT